MSLERNKATARRFLDSVVRGDADLSLVTDDFTFWTPISGEVSRRDLPAALRAEQASLAQPMEMVEDAITAEGDRVAVESHSRAPLIDGKVYANTYHVLVQFTEDGRIRRVREHLDTQHFAETLGPLMRQMMAGSAS